MLCGFIGTYCVQVQCSVVCCKVKKFFHRERPINAYLTYDLQKAYRA